MVALSLYRPMEAKIMQKNKFKKLYISDMDGTLLNRDKELSGYTKNVINALTAKGVQFSVATARSAASAVKILSEIDINVPVVLMNGVVINNLRKKEYIKTETITKEIADAIIDVLGKYGITGFMYTVSGSEMVTFYERLYTKALQDFYNERVTKYYKSFEQTDTFLNKTTGNNIIYFTLLDEHKQLCTVYDALQNITGIGTAMYKDTYSENLWYLEIFNKNASKCNAVKYIRQYCGFDRIIGFGDNYNDMPFFEACDECYAVSNAVHELKEMATGIIDDNNSDGVARFIADKEKLSPGNIFMNTGGVINAV
jgi:5-amino-6-(5-phospho-D-ribitylamino)uracil phosphatase